MNIVEFGTEVRKRRREAGRSLAQLSEMTGVAAPILSRLENGNLGYRPKVEVLQKIADEFGMAIPDEEVHPSNIGTARTRTGEFGAQAALIASKLSVAEATRFVSQCRQAGDSLRRRLYEGALARTAYQIALDIAGVLPDMDEDIGSLRYCLGRCSYDIANGRNRTQPDTNDPRDTPEYTECLSLFEQAWPAVFARGTRALNTPHPNEDGLRHIHEYQSLLSYSARSMRRLLALNGYSDPSAALVAVDQVRMRVQRPESQASLESDLKLANDTKSIVKAAIHALFIEANAVNNQGCAKEPLGPPQYDSEQHWVWYATFRNEQARLSKELETCMSGTYDTVACAKSYRDQIDVIRKQVQVHKKKSELTRVLAYTHREVGFTWCSGNAPNHAEATLNFLIAKKLIGDQDPAEHEFIDGLMHSISQELRTEPEERLTALLRFSAAAFDSKDYPLQLISS